MVNKVEILFSLHVLIELDISDVLSDVICVTMKLNKLY